MLAFLRSLYEAIRYGSPPGMAGRSPHWPAVEREHKLREPRCQWCGRLDHVEVHHIQGFEEHPELELVESNLISLCRPPGTVYGSCHFVHGHWVEGARTPNWKTYRPTVRADCLAHQRETIN